MNRDGDVFDSYGNSLRNIKQSFQDGCNTLVSKCTELGVTPSSNSPSDISNAIQTIAGNTYNNGYYNGRAQGQQDVKNNPNGYGLYTQQQYDQNYNNGYNAGVSAGQGSVAGSYQLDFRINAHDEKVNSWIRYRDWITLDIKSNGTASLGSHSFMNAQIRSDQGEYCKISKV